MRKTILTTVAVTVASTLLACTPKPTSAPTPSKPTPSPTAVSRETQPQPVEGWFDDCGDSNPPCVTEDEGAIRLVTSATPYRELVLPVCSAEDYPKVMPCVLREPAPNGKWLTLRRNP